ncbi:MAG: protease modulator HflC [Lentisphaerae bacterium]|nr:protease modulator HflC [Lentisphaerota bacterium]MCP4100821.1 protease modulator HflC [Lentisphaerota bacterium]
MKIVIGIIVIVIILAAVFFTSSIYTVSEGKQAVITQFGRPIGEPITTAGLHFKKPFIQKIHYFEKKLLRWNGDPNQIPTKDKKYIWVDTTARWKIVDPLKFLQSVNSEQGAHSRLDDIINSATRDVITGHLLVEAVRDSNRIINEDNKAEDSGDKVLADATLEPISTGREQLEEIILKRAGRLAPKYGIELVDVRIKRLNYVTGVRQKVYGRMIAERKRAAEKYRSEGQGKKAEIDGKRGKELKLIASGAYRKAQGIKGKADSQVTKIYADAYGKNPKFYAFLKTHETYRKGIDKNTTLILSTGNDYYKYLKSSNTE